MSTSGGNTSTMFAYTARQIIERALRQAGVPRERFNGEMIADAYDIFNTALLEMLNLGMQLWGRDQVLVPLYENRNQVPMPLGTSLVMNVEQRTSMRPTPIEVSTTGEGDPMLAFDDDLRTSCINSTPNSIIRAMYASATQITQLGIFFTQPGDYAFMIEITVDGGVTWIPKDALNPTVAMPGEWKWYEMQGMPTDMTGIQLRSIGNTVVAIGELYFGNNPVDIPLGKWNVNDWDQQPNKLDPGLPWNYYQDRTRETPVLNVWQCPNAQARYIRLVCRRRRYLDFVTNMQQTLDISPRWYEAFTASMARRVCKEIPEADIKRFQMLQSEETTAMLLATGEERDNSPTRFNPGIEVYDF